jgi:hypothetical protein
MRARTALSTRTRLSLWLQLLGEGGQFIPVAAEDQPALALQGSRMVSGPTLGLPSMSPPTQVPKRTSGQGRPSPAPGP